MPAGDHPPATETGPKRILIIEDDQVSLFALAQLVQTAGYIATTAADAADAIKSFETETPDLILLDINLPGETFGQQMDGLGVIDWLNYRHPDRRIKYIIVSCDDPGKHKGRTAAAQAFCFMQKPVETDLLLASIRNAIEDPLDAVQPATTNPESS